MNKPVWPWWLLALTYYVACCLMHLRFSIWLVRRRDTLLGSIAYSDLMPGLVITGLVGLTVWIALGLRRSARPWLTSFYWLLWLASAGLIDHYLTFSINEHAHYPQYALMALLLARAMDPGRKRWYVGRVLFWTTLLGIGDELSQYLWITTSYSDYLDFNDFVTNLVAAAAGVLLYYGTAAPPQRSGAERLPVVELAVTSVIVALVLLGLQTGRLVPTPAEKIAPGGMVQLSDGSHRLYLQRGPDHYGSQPVGPRHGSYHVLRPVPGLLLLLLLGSMFASYRRFSATRQCSAASASPGGLCASNSAMRWFRRRS
ncbi:MAG: VanZ family protein [Rhodoferax sp.]